MGMIRSGYADLLNPAFRDAVFLKYSQLPTYYDKIFNVMSSTQKEEKETGIASIGLIPEKVESTDASEGSLTQGYDKTYTHKAYSIYLNVSHELMSDDLKNVIKRIPAAIARSAALTVDVEATNIINRDTTAAYTGPDGKVLAATDHPLVGSGGTEQNTLSTDADLSPTSLQQALTDIESTLGHNGQVIGLRAQTLLVPTANQWVGMELLQSNLKPYTGNNETNVILGKGLNLIVNPHISDTDSWKLLAAKDQHSLNFFWREQPRMEAEDVMKSQTTNFMIFLRFSVGWTDWIGYYGCAGA